MNKKIDKPSDCSCCRPAASTQAGASAEEEPRPRSTLRVADMCCADEVAAVERALKPLPGVRSVDVNLMRGTVAIDHDDSIDQGVLVSALARSGLRATPADSNTGRRKADSIHRTRLAAVSLSGLFTATGLILSWTSTGHAWLAPAFFAVAILSGGWFILPKAVGAIRHRALDMNALMTVAAIGAAIIGEWGEAAAVVFLFSLSELLEALSLGRARRAIEALMELSPDTALVRRGDATEEVPVENVRVGDTIAVRSGARIPLDGEVVSGKSSVNQAPITGESMPVDKEPSDTVFAGTINGDGSLDARVTTTSDDTTLARIIHLVEEAQSQKAQSQRFVDVFAKYYTPAVFALALLVGVIPPLLTEADWFTWTYRALVLLVIACPCALVISTPVSIVSGLTAMARRGVLVKGGIALETVGRLTAVAVDKTGTITEGHPRVSTVIAGTGHTDAELLRIAASIDVHSTHPLAQAVVEHARASGIELPTSENYRNHSGRGAEAEVDGKACFVGSARFAEELGVATREFNSTIADLENEALSVVLVGLKPSSDSPGALLGLIAIGDTVRTNAPAAVQAFHRAGVKTVVMLSGDNQRSVDAIAKQVGIDQAFGNLLPDEKLEKVRELAATHRHVGMIGDGVNDAPAMALASVGIAMGAAGTDVALETADIALMEDDLTKVGDVIRLGRRVVRIIQANIAFALGLKALFLVLAVIGYTSLWLAILADMGATLLVVANALRLLKRVDRKTASS